MIVGRGRGAEQRVAIHCNQVLSKFALNFLFY